MTRNADTSAAPPRSRRNIPAQDDMSFLPKKRCKTPMLPQLVDAPAPAAVNTIEQHSRGAIPTKSCFRGIWQKIQSTVGSEQQCRKQKEKLEGEGWFGRKAWQGAGSGVEVRHTARLAGNLDEEVSLALAWIIRSAADRRHKSAIFLELRKQRGRRLGHAAVEQDHVIRTAGRMPLGQSPCHDHGVGDVKLGQGTLGSVGKLWLGLEPDHRLAKTGKHCRRVTSGTADVEHSFMRFDACELDEPGKDHRREEEARGRAVD